MAITSRWAHYRSVAYLVGKGLIVNTDYEFFPRPAVDKGKYAIYIDTARTPLVDICDDNISFLANDSFDYVLIGLRIGEAKDPQALISSAIKKLRVGGHLIMHQPLEADHEACREFVASLGSWILKDTTSEAGTFIQIYKRTRGSSGVVERPRPSRPRACIARYGAMGDMVMVTPLIRALADDGFEVTVNCTAYSAPILDNNPHVHNLLIQERDAIPNPELGDYWSYWSKQYDRYINLSESIEGRLLKVEGRRDYFTSRAWRTRQCNHNYYDFTLKLGGYPNLTGRRGELYLSREERRFAEKLRNQYAGKRIILWSLGGSSHHKVYGYFEPTAREWLDKHPDSVIITVGDERVKPAEFEHERLIRKCGMWSIRQTFAALSVVDLVVGAESVAINAAGCFDVPKVPILSHSTHHNLCEHFVNDFCISPDPALVPCYPCNQLHYSRGSCPLQQSFKPDNSPLLVWDPGDQKFQPDMPACCFGIIPSCLVSRMEEALAASSTLSA